MESPRQPTSCPRAVAVRLFTNHQDHRQQLVTPTLLSSHVRVLSTKAPFRRRRVFFCGRRGHPQTPLGGHPSPCTASPSPPRGHVHETMTGRGGATTGVLVLAAGRWGWAARGASIVRSHKTTHPFFLCLGAFVRSCVGTAAAKRDQTRAPNALSTGTPLRGGVCDVVCGLRFVKRRAGPGFIPFFNFYPPPPKRGHPRPRPRPRRPSPPTADRRPPTAAHRPPPARRPCPRRKSSRVESSRALFFTPTETRHISPPRPVSPSATSRSLA